MTIEKTRGDFLQVTAGEDGLKHVSTETRELQRLKAKVAEQSCEIAILTLLVRDSEAATAEVTTQRDWIGKVASLLQSQPGWWGYMPKIWRERRVRRRLAFHGIFDGDAYLKRYPDVATAGMDPLFHYISHGLAEGRER